MEINILKYINCFYCIIYKYLLMYASNIDMNAINPTYAYLIVLN